jgi:hypothetical protein
MVKTFTVRVVTGPTWSVSILGKTDRGRKQLGGRCADANPHSSVRAGTCNRRGRDGHTVRALPASSGGRTCREKPGQRACRRRRGGAVGFRLAFLPGLPPFRSDFFFFFWFWTRPARCSPVSFGRPLATRPPITGGRVVASLPLPSLTVLPISVRGGCAAL